MKKTIKKAIKKTTKNAAFLPGPAFGLFAAALFMILIGCTQALSTPPASAPSPVPAPAAAPVAASPPLVAPPPPVSTPPAPPAVIGEGNQSLSSAEIPPYNESDDAQLQDLLQRMNQTR